MVLKHREVHTGGWRRTLEMHRVGHRVANVAGIEWAKGECSKSRLEA